MRCDGCVSMAVFAFREARDGRERAASALRRGPHAGPGEAKHLQKAFRWAFEGIRERERGTLCTGRKQ